MSVGARVGVGGTVRRHTPSGEAEFYTTSSGLLLAFPPPSEREFAYIGVKIGDRVAWFTVNDIGGVVAPFVWLLGSDKLAERSCELNGLLSRCTRLDGDRMLFVEATSITDNPTVLAVPLKPSDKSVEPPAEGWLAVAVSAGASAGDNIININILPSDIASIDDVLAASALAAKLIAQAIVRAGPKPPLMLAEKSTDDIASSLLRGEPVSATLVGDNGYVKLAISPSHEDSVTGIAELTVDIWNGSVDLPRLVIKTPGTVARLALLYTLSALTGNTPARSTIHAILAAHAASISRRHQ